MFNSLEGKGVIVTGGSSGIGKSIVEILANNGMNVAAFYNSTFLKLDEFENSLSRCHGKVKMYQVDVTNQDTVIDTINEVERDFGEVLYLVNCAGIAQDAYMVMMERSKWDNVINTNLNGAYYVSQAVLPGMLSAGCGAIVNISSIAGEIGVIGQTNYCAAKAGLIGMTKALAKEMAGKNIRVNAIAPGYIDTRMIDKVKKKDKNLIDKIPMGRYGKVEEVASTVLFLLSDGASYITGTTIIVDGGILA